VKDRYADDLLSVDGRPHLHEMIGGRHGGVDDARVVEGRHSEEEKRVPLRLNQRSVGLLVEPNQRRIMRGVEVVALHSSHSQRVSGEAEEGDRSMPSRRCSVVGGCQRTWKIPTLRRQTEEGRGGVRHGPRGCQVCSSGVVCDRQLESPACAELYISDTQKRMERRL
jgi:hypothetical protein